MRRPEAWPTLSPVPLPFGPFQPTLCDSSLSSHSTSVAGAMFTGYTATQLGVSDVARIDRGAATALYFSIYYASGALGAYVPGLAWERFGWGGVAFVGLGALIVAAVALGLVHSHTENRA